MLCARRDQISKLQLENQDLMGKFDVSLVAQRKIQEELDSMKNKHGSLDSEHVTAQITHSRERDGTYLFILICNHHCDAF